MKDRLPTEFETRVLKNIVRARGGYQSGDRRVHFIAAARRLEKLGYATKPSTHWWVTDKGEKYLTEIAKTSNPQ